MNEPVSPRDGFFGLPIYASPIHLGYAPSISERFWICYLTAVKFISGIWVFPTLLATVSANEELPLIVMNFCSSSKAVP